MALLQGAIFLFFGVGLMVIDYRALRDGSIPVWGLGETRAHRGGRPVRFWLAFVLYGAGGVVLTIYALRLLAGLNAPLPLA